MADKKAVTLEHLEIVKNYINNNDAENIKSAEFVDDTLKFYTTEDKSGEAIAEITLPEETFLDGSKTEIVSDFSWSKTKYPKSTDPELDGKAVLVLAVKAGKTVRYSFASLDSVITRLTDGETESANVSVADDAVSLNVKISELSDNRVIIKDDGLYVGTVDNTPTWTVSTDEEVWKLFSVSGAPIISANSLGARNVGDIVQINEDGVPTDFIVVHKGNPDPEIYDASCDGVWVLRKRTLHGKVTHLGTETKYAFENSKYKAFLDGEYYNSFDESIKSSVISVKLPHKIGGNDASQPLVNKEDGLEAKVFLLSSREVGLLNDEIIKYGTEELNTPEDGAKLDYFTDNDSRKATYFTGRTDAPSRYILRTPAAYSSDYAVIVEGNGSFHIDRIRGAMANGVYLGLPVRPAFILPYNVLVDSDGVVMP